MDWADVYSLSSSERLQELEEQLSKELHELNDEIQDNAAIGGAPARYISTIPIPKNVEHFRRERQSIIRRSLSVSQAKPTELQSNTMWHEQNIANQYEYTPESIPLLLHQYFLDQAHQLTTLKYMHMLRWKRFCKNSKIIESLYPVFTARLQAIMQEYNDCVSRCHRLSVADESLMARSDLAMLTVQADDLLIYLRHLICNLHSIQKFNCFLKVLDHLPVSHYKHFHAPDMQVQSDANKFMAHFQEEGRLSITSQPSEESLNAGLLPHTESMPTEHPAASSFHLLQNLVQKDTSALPSILILDTQHEEKSYVGLTERNEESLPLNCNELESLKPQLMHLLNLYNINFVGSWK